MVIFGLDAQMKSKREEVSMIVGEAHDILDAEEVAKMLRVSARTVKNLASKHQLPGFKVGGQWRFRREAIEEYIRKQEQQGQQEES
jgi:excisionase family DNA binding protein